MSRYSDHIVDVLSDWAPVRARAMFGGFGLYRDDVIFALIADDDLYFKVDDTNRDDYERAGSAPFSYEMRGKPASMPYWRVPEEVIEDAEMLGQWATKAHAVGVRTRSKPRRGKPT